MSRKYKMRTVIETPAQELSAEHVIYMLFGKTVEEFVKDVQLNRNGEYNQLYGEEAGT